MRTSRIITAICAAALTLPAFAAAQGTVPSDNAGGGQYLPSVPSGGGDQSESQIKNDASDQQDNVSEPVVEDLEAESPEGGEVAAVAAATAPESEQLDQATARAEQRAEREQLAELRAERRAQERQQARRQEQRQERREANEQADEQRQAVAAAGDDGGGGGRIGIVFPLLLLVGTLICVGGRWLLGRRALSHSS